VDDVEDLLVSETFRIVNKPPRVHHDEVLTQGEISWKPVHRLDFETSGCLLLARLDHFETYRGLFNKDADFKTIEKIYWAGSTRLLPAKSLGEVRGLIGGRYRASKKVVFATDMERLKGFHGVQAVHHRVANLSASDKKEATKFKGDLYRVELVSGARHQIRAWFASLKAPLKGDPIYGEPGERLELHARELAFIDPLTREQVRVKAPL